MKLLRELGLDSMPNCHFGLGNASLVAGLSYGNVSNLLRDEIERGHLLVFHVLPGMPRVRFCDLADWYEDRAGKIPAEHWIKPPYYRKSPLLESRQAFAYRCVNHALNVGLLERGTCIYCGEQAHAHHPDYRKPLWLVWLCRTHHQLHHGRINQAVSLLRKTSAPAQLEFFPNRSFYQSLEARTK